MSSLLELLPWLAAMGLLIGLSAFFSASEAALFYLRPGDRHRLKQGTRSQRTAARLLSEPDRLLSGVLFWNLVVNIFYFALSSVVALQIEQSPVRGSGSAIGFAVLTLVLLIFCSEMLPKSLAVIHPMLIARLVSLPLSVAIRLTDPVMPLLRGMTLISRRLFWPGFRPEPYMELADLERAIQISSDDEAIVEQEHTVLRNIVGLADIRVDEWMRPRAQFQVFQPPVSLRDLQGSVTPSGYLLVSEPDSEEVEKAFRLDSVSRLPEESIDELAQPVLYLPWQATVADALEEMSRGLSQVTAIVNEFGETIGVLTIEDVLETVFTYQPSRSKRLLDLNPIHKISAGRWAVSGMMSLKRLGSYFDEPLPETRSVTVAGVIQEATRHVAEPGDHCRWGPFEFRVIEAPQADNILVELRYASEEREVPE